MKLNTTDLIKNIIDENAVAFKENASTILYSKVGKKIEGMYENIAKTIIGNKNETDNRAN
jgi:hypothetical protein